jgi:hypothetical protein
VKVLFFALAAMAAWLDWAHSQQLDLQIWEKAVSGTYWSYRTDDCSTLYCKLLLSADPSPGSSENMHGHSTNGRVGSVKLSTNAVTSHPQSRSPPPEPPNYASARFLALICPSLFLIEAGAAKAPARSATKRTVF